MKILRLIQKLLPDTTQARMPGFDEVYYRYWYRDTAQFPGPPLQHYLQHGWKEGRDLSAGFSTDGYLAANPDVSANGFDPLSHFLAHGLSEARKGWEKSLHAPAPGPRYLPDGQAQKLLMPPREQ